MATENNERLTTRVSNETKQLLEQAAALSGYSSLNSFITNAALKEAKKLIKQEMVIELCQQDAIAFMETLDAPLTVTPRFLKAAQAYKEKFNNGNQLIR